jgi:hypothetical protein
VCVTYDALDRVVEQAKGSACATSPMSTTEIVYNPSGARFALMNGSTLTKAFVSLPGGAQAVYNTSGLQYYRHPDWLLPAGNDSDPDDVLRRSICPIRRELCCLGNPGPLFYGTEPGHRVQRFRRSRRPVRFHVPEAQPRAGTLALARFGGPRSGKSIRPADMESLRLCWKSSA